MSQTLDDRVTESQARAAGLFLAKGGDLEQWLQSKGLSLRQRREITARLRRERQVRLNGLKLSEDAQ